MPHRKQQQLQQLQIQLPNNSGKTLDFGAIPRKDQTPFDIERILANTLFGHVVLATCRSTKRKVAVKISSLKAMQHAARDKLTSENPVSETRTMRLATDAAKRSEAGGSQHFVQLLDEFIHDNCHWAVQEFADQGDLFGVITKNTRMPEPLAKAVFGKLLSAISFLHSAGIAHLDIKPENVLVTKTNEIKLCDFGMAVETKSRMQGKRGTMMYMAPEVAKGQSFDPCLADVYSAGVSLFLMLTGGHAYEQPTESDRRFAAVISGREGLDALLQAYGIKLSHKAVDLLSKMIAPEDRRCSLESALKHPWLRTGITPKLTPKPSLTARLEHVARSTDLKSRRMPLTPVVNMDTAFTPAASPRLAAGALPEIVTAPASPAPNRRQFAAPNPAAMNICANLLALAAN